ncbi:hypothetical protein GCM10011579_011550 [Streptomyces albiflavescens]|uniref:Uncharacterized protein n=1 Tax=Streptomyces albiflavescens TaxID=1623582 RepID=A0A918D095_9ACTN|nr:hypothetical protein GCM10011579_011550 [Streptomyces albiflavescens]
MDGVRVVGAVAEPRRDGNAALGRQDEFEFEFAFHHGVHVVRFLSCPGPCGRARTSGERVGPEPLREFREISSDRLQPAPNQLRAPSATKGGFFPDNTGTRLARRGGTLPERGGYGGSGRDACAGLIDVEPSKDPRADTGRRT